MLQAWWNSKEDREGRVEWGKSSIVKMLKNFIGKQIFALTSQLEKRIEQANRNFLEIEEFCKKEFVKQIYIFV